MHIRTLTSFFCFLLSLNLVAQTGDSKKEIIQQYKALSIELPELKPDIFLSQHKGAMGLSDSDEWTLVSEQVGKNNYSHFKYKQTHKNISVYGTSYVLHTRGGKVVSANGSFLPKIKLNPIPAISSQEALTLARKELGIPTEADADHKTEPLQAHNSEKQELVIIDKELPDYSGSYALAYMLDMNLPEGCKHGEQPASHKSCNHGLGSKRFFIDAHSGNVLQSISLIEEQGVPAQCKTLYYGEKTLTIDSLSATSYALKDPTRGLDGIAVTDDDENIFNSEDGVFDENDEGFEYGAVDALYSTVAYYDMMVEHFDWKGLDNEDKSFEIGVYAFGRDEYVNAFWNGRKVWIGNGDCNFGPLATLTVIGHEFTHGIIDNTSNLIYSSESGGINESIADVIGKTFEYEIYPEDFTWGIGAVFSPEIWEPFRIMDDPLTKDHPAYYRGDNWIDDNDVHINSSIGNLWYVLLADGGEAVNELGVEYSVSEIGKLSAGQFIFHINRHYLVENSGYNDYYDASLLAAEELYPGDGAFKDNIKEAWKAVGLPNYPSVAGDFVDLSVETQSLYQLCGYGSYLSAYVEVENLGTLDYTADMNGKLVVKDGNAEILREIVLTEDLAVDELVRIELDSILEIEEYFSRITVDLELVDDKIEENNDDRTFVLTTEFVADNVAVSMIFAEHVCFSEEQEVTIVIRNESCDPIIEGTEMNLLIQNENGEVILEESYDLDRTLNRSAAVDLDRVISVPRVIDDSYEISLTMTGIIDPDMSDNTTEYEVLSFQVVDVDYSNEFSVEDDLKNELLIATGLQPSILLQDFMGNSAFHVRGSGGRDELLLCPELLDNFTGDGLSPFDNIKAIMRLCADLTGETSASMHFDVALSRNDNTLYPSEASSSLLLEWVDENTEETGQLIVSGQPENALLSYDIPLPDDFKGGVAFSFVAISDGIADEVDELYFDNLNFGQAVDTEDLVENSLSIFPNPASSILNMTVAGTIQSTQVIDIHGRVILQGVEKQIDVDRLVPGSYLIKVLLSDGHTWNRRFIKL